MTDRHCRRLAWSAARAVALAAPCGCASRAATARDGPQDGSTYDTSSDAAFDCASLDSDGGSADGGFVPAPHRHIPVFAPPQEGGVPSTLNLVTITASNDPLAPQLQAFTDALAQSQWLQTVSVPYGLRGLSANLHVTNAPPITTSLVEPDVESYVVGVVQSGAPRPAGDTLYLLFVPSAGSLAGTVGYHDTFRTPGFEADEFAAVERNPFPIYPETDFDTETVAASHEIFETWTNYDFRGLQYPSPPPDPWISDGAAGSVWSSAFSSAMELCDVCAATRTFEPLGDGGYFYTRVFDNQVAACGADNECIPRESGPDYNVTVDRDWFAGAAKKRQTCHGVTCFRWRVASGRSFPRLGALLLPIVGLGAVLAASLVECAALDGRVVRRELDRAACVAEEPGQLRLARVARTERVGGRVVVNDCGG